MGQQKVWCQSVAEIFAETQATNMELDSLNISIGVQKLSHCQRAQIWDELKPICNYTIGKQKKEHQEEYAGLHGEKIKANLCVNETGEEMKKSLCPTSSSSGKGSKTKTASSDRKSVV